MKNLIRVGVAYLGIVMFLFSQPYEQSAGREQYGFQGVYAPRTINTILTIMTQGFLNYSYQTAWGTQVIFSIGANDFTIPGSTTGVSKFNSGFSTAYRVGLKQSFAGLFIRGELWYYTAEGLVTTNGLDSITYSFQNTYSFYEGPFQLGYNLDLGRLNFTMAVTTSFFYGKNQRSLTILDHAYPMDFGKKTTNFITRLPVGVAVGVNIPVSSGYYLQIGSTWYEANSYSVSLALWGTPK